MTTDELAYRCADYPCTELVIEHKLSTGQVFRFNLLDVRFDASINKFVLITNGTIVEDLDSHAPTDKT